MRESELSPAIPAVRIVISVVLLTICITLVPASDLTAALKAISPPHLLAAILLSALGTVIPKALIAHCATRGSGATLGFPSLIRINLVARFYTLVLPRGASALVRWHHYRHGSSGDRAAVLLFMESITSMLTLFSTAAAILTFMSISATTGAIGRVLLPLAWAGTLCSAAILALVLSGSGTAAAQSLLKPLTHRITRLADLVDGFAFAMTSYRLIKPRTLWVIATVSLLGHACFILSAWVIALGIGLELELAAIAWIRSVTSLVALIPITVAGMGLREGTLIALLYDYGVDAASALALALVSFVIQLLFGIVGGLLEAHRIMIGRRSYHGNEGAGT